MKQYLIAALLAAGCGGSPTGATCPTDNPPTYASFGEAFFTTYCTDCHSASSRNRHGAPTDENYDTEADVMKHAAKIDIEAAGGPQATNTSMPDLSGDVMDAPTDAERVLLGQFLACEQTK